MLFADGTVAMDVIGTRPGLGTAEGDAAGPDSLAPGDQRARRGLERGNADREGPARPRLDQESRRRVRRALVRAHGRGHQRLRDELARRGSRPGSSPRSRSRRPSTNLEAIVAEADAVMVARGDLGVELDVTRVPAIQKQIIDTCQRRAGSGDHGDADAQQHGDSRAGRPAPRRATCSTPCSTAPTP